MNIIRKLFVVLLVLAMMLTVMPLIAMPTVAEADGGIEMAMVLGDPGSLPGNPATNEVQLKAAIGNEGIETIYISGTIPLTSALTITRDLTIIGEGQGTTNITVNSNFRHFFSSTSNITLRLENMTLSGGTIGGGVQLSDDSKLIMENCTVQNCHTGGSGGGVYALAAYLTNCTFIGNTAGFNGGGMWVDGTATLNNCTFTGNEATDNGGGVYVAGDNTLIMENCTFTGNTATNGGGVYVAGGDSTLIMENCTFEKNTANNGGGVWAVTATLTNCTFTGNTATFDGGGVWAENTATLTNCTFTGNTANNDGGGVFVWSPGTATLTNCTFIGNTATLAGGGVWAATATLNNCTVTGNTAINGAGGGVYADTTYLNNCTFTDNTAAFDGGGVFASNTATLNNCTFTGNTAISGGGVWAATATLISCTFTSNTATFDGGGVVWATTATIRGSIVAGNTAGGVNDVAVIDAPWQDPDPDNSYNIIGGDVADIFGSNKLASNDGLTQTILIRAGGPAHDKIPAATLSDWGVTHDQRGVERPQETYGDIGAVELSYIPTPPHNEILDPPHNVPPTGVTRSVLFPMLGLSIGVLFIVGAEVYRRRLK